ncbi:MULTISPECIES: carbohydrate kinase family protein [unclassified Pedobacter]|uniref:carbohydrate kinase family protein n=1 Tax=unclassified Pedobacter TaxID=2628915 RepID=UPI0014244FAD|nr:MULTISPECIES: carbohydrate kinase [unclassified Pedobacter]NII85851.1 fructokinase [Pedobacter sp. SG908]NMN39234.1 fructokinase [Pedobacter sp. SG918]
MQNKVITIGEILWDVFPEGKKAGGSSMNVALNLHKQSIESSFISAIGNDENGKELFNFLASNHFATNLIQVNTELPTSTVVVQLDENHQATYTIKQPVAWDSIKITDENIAAVKQADALVYCSLTCREEKSKKTILALLENAKIKIFDINLRAPFYSKELIDELLAKADILKINEDEILWVKESFGLSGNTDEQLLKQLSNRFNIEMICLTLGDKGACILKDGKLFKHAGYKVQVADTVGAGDAFLATFIACYLQGYPMETTLDNACKVGAFVASQAGANPDYNKKIYHMALG